MGRTAWIFPGQGSQSPGMGRACAEALPSCAEIFDRADRALETPLSRLIFDGPAAELDLTENTQPAILTTSVAVLQAVKAAGLGPPDFVAGHSLGEYSALVAADVLSLEDAVRAVRLRGRFMQEAVPPGVGAMAAILSLSLEAVEEACAEARSELGQVVQPANVNGAAQVVIAGHAEAVRRAGELCKARGARRVLPLPVSAPFHCPLMEPVRPRLSDVLSGLRFRDAAVPVVTNVEAAPEISAERLRELLVEQVTSPVRWTDVVARLAAEGCDTFVEIGPGNVLAGLVRRQLPEAKVLSVSDPAQVESARAVLAA